MASFSISSLQSPQTPSPVDFYSYLSPVWSHLSFSNVIITSSLNHGDGLLICLHMFTVISSPVLSPQGSHSHLCKLERDPWSLLCFKSFSGCLLLWAKSLKGTKWPSSIFPHLSPALFTRSLALTHWLSFVVPTSVLLFQDLWSANPPRIVPPLLSPNDLNWF